MGCAGGILKNKSVIQFAIITFQQGPIYTNTNRHSSVTQSSPNKIMIEVGVFTPNA
jgi:hypothetical protein